MCFSYSLLLNDFSNVKHCFTTRICGNLAFHVNDNLKSVILKHKELAKSLNYNFHSLIHMKQIHSSSIHIINENDNFNNPQSCDALITNKINIPLMVMVADCSPILFYDSVRDVIAVAHAGREGTFKNIVKNVIDSMNKNFDSISTDIKVSIGASIGVCCYEVGSEISDEAKKLSLDYAIQIRENRYYLNISKILESQLLESGILKENLEISNECTCCQSDKYFSYRADKNTGRFAGIICLT